MRRACTLVVRASLAAALLVSLCGFQVFGAPNGEDQAPDHPDDPRWAQFRGVKVVADKARGVLIARFPKDLLAADGKPLDLGGYITPLEVDRETAHFILTRRSTGCPFCPPNEANEALEVFLRKKIHDEQRQVFVKGRLKLVTNSDRGLFFEIVDGVAS